MLLTEKQLFLLIDVLKDSLTIEGHFCISQNQRTELYSCIMNQQSNLITEIKGEKLN